MDNIDNRITADIKTRTTSKLNNNQNTKINNLEKPIPNNIGLLKELHEKDKKRIKLRQSSIGDFDITDIKNLKSENIDITLNKIREAQKSRAKFIEENFNQNTIFPSKTLTLAEIEQIPFNNFCEEIQKEKSTKENLDKTLNNNNINFDISMIKKNKNKNRFNYDFEEFEKEIQSEIERNKDVYIENLSNVRKIMLIDEDKKFFKRTSTLRNTPNLGSASPKDTETNKGELKGDNNIKMNKVEYVNFVFDFVGNIIHEHKIKHKF